MTFVYIKKITYKCTHFTYVWCKKFCFLKACVLSLRYRKKKLRKKMSAFSYEWERKILFGLARPNKRLRQLKSCFLETAYRYAVSSSGVYLRREYMCVSSTHPGMCVCVCHMYESSVYMKLIVNWYYIGSSSLVGGPIFAVGHIQHVCVCMFLYVYQFRAGSCGAI